MTATQSAASLLAALDEPIGDDNVGPEWEFAIKMVAIGALAAAVTDPDAREHSVRLTCSSDDVARRIWRTLPYRLMEGKRSDHGNGRWSKLWSGDRDGVSVMLSVEYVDEPTEGGGS